MIQYSSIGLEVGTKVNKKIKSIAIYSSKNKEIISQIANQVIEISNYLGVKVYMPKSSSLKNPFPRSYSDNYIVNNVDMVLSVGGDGTFLSSARRFGSKKIPILGINLGNVGFLTDIPPDDLTESLKSVFTGNYIQDTRSFIEAKKNNQKNGSIALNEAVIHSGSIAKLMEYELLINDKFVFRQKADGLIVSTPTGSTAYSLSGNGPIIHPKVNAINLVPMFPHDLSARPLVVDENDLVVIRVCSGGVSKLSLDSHNTFDLKKNDIVKIGKYKNELVIVHPEKHDFFSASRTKLGWSIDKF